LKPLKYSQTQKTIQPWIDQHECIQVYLQRLNANKTRVAVYLYLYCEWAAAITEGKTKTPEDLLALKNSFENSDAEKLLDKFTIAQTVFPDCQKWLMINSVKAFFRNNYKMLQSAAGKFEYTTKKANASASKETCLKLFKACYSPRDQALIMAATCTSIARESMSEIRWSHFEENWQQQEIPCIQLPSSIIKGHGKGKYRGVEQISFLTPEAKRIFQEYRIWYQKTFNHTWQPDDHVFLSVRDNIHEPLSKEGVSRAMNCLTRRAGVKYGIHDGRVRVQTALENVGVSPNWVKKVKGRKVKGEESPYSKPAKEQLRQKYREALPDLEFFNQQKKQETGEKDQVIEKLSQNVEVLTRSLTSFKRQVFRRDHNLPLNTSDEEIDQAMAADEKELNVLRSRGLTVRITEDGTFERVSPSS
jgi:hypothetical protein